MKRELAPLTTEAWVELDDQARRVPRSLLTGRRFADISGPHRAELSALDQAAAKLAAFEGGILYSGTDDAGIRALQQAVSHDPIS